MPTLADLSEAGGWAVFSFLVFWLIVGFYRGWLVPGFIWRDERAQRQRAEEWAERNSKSLALLAEAADDARRARDAKRATDA